MSADITDLNAPSLTVPMTKSLERLLHRAAADRDLAPEALAKRILCDWLLAEGGFKQDGARKREKIRENVDVPATA